MTDDKHFWSSDVPVSMPAPNPNKAITTLETGWVFTENGMFHDITQDTIDALTVTFKPVHDPRKPTNERGGDNRGH